MHPRTLPLTVLLGLLLAGCQPRSAPAGAGEQALANLHTHLRHEDRHAVSRLVPRVCDGGGVKQGTLTCHADLVQQHAGEERTIGTSTFACASVAEGGCEFLSSADADGTKGPGSGGPGACGAQLYMGATVDLQGVGQVAVSDYTNSDTAAGAWASASFTLHDRAVRLTEAQAREALDQLFERTAAVCREHALTRARIFLYPAGVAAGESANWIGRLEHGSTRQVDINHAMLQDARTDRYACIDAPEPGIALDSGTRLPPVRQRDVLGTWAGVNPGLTMSLERVDGKVYRVYRSAYCASGDRGELLRSRADGSYAVVGGAHGDHYRVMASGDLGVFDRQGPVDVLPRHAALHPATASN